MAPDEVSSRRKYVNRGEWHGIWMLKTFHAIIQLNKEKKLAVSNRITEMIGNEDQSHVINRLKLYFEWGYLLRKTVKNTGNRRRSVRGASFHYIMSASGMRKYQRLRAEFPEVRLGDMDISPDTEAIAILEEYFGEQLRSMPNDARLS